MNPAKVAGAQGEPEKRIERWASKANRVQILKAWCVGSLFGLQRHSNNFNSWGDCEDVCVCANPNCVQFLFVTSM